MAREGRSEQLAGQLARGRVLGASDFLADDFDLPLQLDRIEGRARHGIGEHVHSFGEEAGGEHDVIDGLVEARPGIDLASAGLDGAGDVPDQQRQPIGQRVSHGAEGSSARVRAPPLSRRPSGPERRQQGSASARGVSRCGRWPASSMRRITASASCCTADPATDLRGARCFARSPWHARRPSPPRRGRAPRAPR